MKYLVLFPQKVYSIHSHSKIYTGLECTNDAEVEFTVKTWELFEKKNEAIEFAVTHKGVIVEAFEFDIKKEAKK